MKRGPGDRLDIRIGGSVSGQVVAGHGNVTHAGQPVAERDTERPDLRGVGRIIVVADVQGSGSLDNRGQLRLRDELAAGFQAGISAVRQQGVDVERLDLGDGLRLVISPDAVSLPEILDQFVAHVAGTLDTATKVRLSVHFGFVDRTASGWSGAPLVHAARLVDAAEAKQLLHDAERARLAVIVSDHLYRQVVRHHYVGVDPAAYQRISVTEKETTATAWIRLI